MNSKKSKTHKRKAKKQIEQIQKNNIPIHIKIEYSEAVDAKKDILSSQISLIQIVQSIKRYHSIRNEELNLKLKMRKKLREINQRIKKMRLTLPKVKIPSLLRKEEPAPLPTGMTSKDGGLGVPQNTELRGKQSVQEHHAAAVQHHPTPKYQDTGLESELADIQARLKSLGGVAA